MGVDKHQKDFVLPLAQMLFEVEEAGHQLRVPLLLDGLPNTIDIETNGVHKGRAVARPSARCY